MNYEPAKDSSYHATAIREAFEEVGVKVRNLNYLWHGPDGHGFETFTFMADSMHENELKDYKSDEGVMQIVQWDDLFESHFQSYYRVLENVYSYKISVMNHLDA